MQAPLLSRQLWHVALQHSVFQHIHGRFGQWMPGNSLRLLFWSLISSTSEVFVLSIIQLLVKSVAIVLSLLLSIIPSFRAASLGTPDTMTHQAFPEAQVISKLLLTSSNQRLEQRVHARTSHVWSTLVVYEWLDRNLSLIACQITICTWSWISDE